MKFNLSTSNYSSSTKDNIYLAQGSMASSVLMESTQRDFPFFSQMNTHNNLPYEQELDLKSIADQLDSTQINHFTVDLFQLKQQLYLPQPKQNKITLYGRSHRSQENLFDTGSNSYRSIKSQQDSLEKNQTQKPQKLIIKSGFNSLMVKNLDLQADLKGDGLSQSLQTKSRSQMIKQQFKQSKPNSTQSSPQTHRVTKSLIENINLKQQTQRIDQQLLKQKQPKQPTQNLKLEQLTRKTLLILELTQSIRLETKQEIIPSDTNENTDSQATGQEDLQNFEEQVRKEDTVLSFTLNEIMDDLNIQQNKIALVQGDTIIMLPLSKEKTKIFLDIKLLKKQFSLSSPQQQKIINYGKIIVRKVIQSLKDQRRPYVKTLVNQKIIDNDVLEQIILNDCSLQEKEIKSKQSPQRGSIRKSTFGIRALQQQKNDILMSNQEIVHSQIHTTSNKQSQSLKHISEINQVEVYNYFRSFMPRYISQALKNQLMLLTQHKKLSDKLTFKQIDQVGNFETSIYKFQSVIGKFTIEDTIIPLIDCEDVEQNQLILKKVGSHIKPTLLTIPVLSELNNKARNLLITIKDDQINNDEQYQSNQQEQNFKSVNYLEHQLSSLDLRSLTSKYRKRHTLFIGTYSDCFQFGISQECVGFEEQMPMRKIPKSGTRMFIRKQSTIMVPVQSQEKQIMSLIDDANFLGLEEMLILHKTIDINHQTVIGETYLTFGAQGGDDNVIRILLKHGANKHLTNREGQTPFQKALMFQNYAAADMLLRDEKNII